MNWFFIVLIPPALYAIVNYFDKYLVERYVKNGGVGALIIFSGLIGMVIVPCILFFEPRVFSLPLQHMILLVGSGALYIIAGLPYLYALQEDDASLIVPIFQSVPVFVYILGYISLGETLTPSQVLASVLIMSGALGLSFEFGAEKRIKLRMLCLMLLSSFLYALNFVIFKSIALEANFWTTSFWEYIGFIAVGGFCFFSMPAYRKQFREMLKTNKTFVIGINGANECISTVAKIVLNYVSLLAPIALVNVVGTGTQSFFIFLFGVLLTTFFPNLIKEDISKKIILQKITAIAIMLIGTIILNK